ncbi:MAG: tetratricopeptide repeat protein [Novosphingobium sp.]
MGAAQSPASDHGQRKAEAWKRCLESDSDAAIAACTTLLRRGMERRENLAMVLFDRGNAWREKDNLTRAIADYSHAIRLNAGFADAFVNRGVAWFRMRRFESAIADFDEAIRLRPDLAEGWNNRALAWHRLGQYERAKADFDRTIVLEKNYGNALIARPMPSRAPPDISAAVR